MARLTAGFALAAVLVLAAGVSPGNGQILLPTDPSTGCLVLPDGKFPSPLRDVYKFLTSLTPVRIIPGGEASLCAASDGKGNVVLVKINCSDPKQLWVRDSFSPEYLNLTAGPKLNPPGGDSKPFGLVNLGAIIDSKEMQATEYVEGKFVYPNIKLARYSPNSVPPSMMWTQDDTNPKLSNSGFYQIRPVKDTTRYMACATKTSYVSTAHNSNVEPGYWAWKMVTFLSNP